MCHTNEVVRARPSGWMNSTCLTLLDEVLVPLTVFLFLLALSVLCSLQTSHDA